MKKRNIFDLTNREISVLKLLVKGFSNQQIAEELQISYHTSKAHVRNILHKMEAKNRVRAAIMAVKANLM